MALRRGVSKELEKAAEQQRRSEELYIKADQKALTALIAVQPQLATTCLRHLESLGIDVYNPAPAPESGITPSKVAQGHQKRQETLKRKAAQIENDQEAELVKSIPLKQRVPTKYWKIGVLSKQLMIEKVLDPMDHVPLAAPSLQRAFRQHSAATCQEQLNQLFEFTTGLVADAVHLRGEMRDWQKILQHTKSHYEAMGNRGRTLPCLADIDWEQHGVYEFKKVSPERIHLKHRFRELQGECRVPEATMAGLRIMNNFSDARAILTPDGGTMSGVNVHELLTVLQAHGSAQLGLLHKGAGPRVLSLDNGEQFSTPNASRRRPSETSEAEASSATSSSQKQLAILDQSVA